MTIYRLVVAVVILVSLANQSPMVQKIAPDSGGVADYNCRVGYEVWESDNSWNAFNTYTGFQEI